jgi:hypothetical protein
MRGENINVWGFLYSSLQMRLSSKQFLFYRCKLKSHDRAVYLYDMIWEKREMEAEIWYFYCIDNLSEAWFSYILSYITFLFFFFFTMAKWQVFVFVQILFPAIYCELCSFFSLCLFFFLLMYAYCHESESVSYIWVKTLTVQMFSITGVIDLLWWYNIYHCNVLGSVKISNRAKISNLWTELVQLVNYQCGLVQFNGSVWFLK